MVSLKLENFGGMIPAVNDYYLPENAAALSQNAWVYTGALEGFRELRSIYTCSTAAVRKVFRIPLGFYDKDRMSNSYWMEFNDPDTDVLSSPLANDQFERYYWASPSHQPLYNPKSRITSANKSAVATISIGANATVTETAHGLTAGDPVYFTTEGTTHTGDTTSGSTSLANVSPAPSSAMVGSTISGSGIPANTTISAVVGSTITLSAAATATATGVSVTIGGRLPTGVTAGAYYFVIATGLTTDTFRFATTPGGSAVTTSGTQYGTHTLWVNQPLTLGVPAPSSAPTAVHTPPNSSVTIGIVTGVTVTMTIASPCVLTWTSHGLAVGDTFYLTTTGALPTGVSANTTYYVTTVVDANTLQFSATSGGTAINSSGTQSGVHSAFKASNITWSGHGLSVGSAFYLTTTGSLPTGVTANTNYYVTKVVDANTIRFSATVGGVSITATGSQSGTHTAFNISGINESRAYIYTWVTAYGEEGPPSNPSSVIVAYANGSTAITITNPTNAEAAARKLSKVRIYRAVTSSTGVATYFQVAELNVGTTTYTDTTANVSGNNQLQSLYWSGPPTDLEGMIALPNGMVAGFRSNEIWFCEPYRLHAWPVAYSLSVDYPIIGLGVIGQTLVVCTAVSPYAVSGVNPAVMSMSRLSSGQSCLSRGSIVSTPAGVLFAAPEGLVVATPGGVSIATRSMITKDKWADLLKLSTLRATLFNDGYYCWGSAQGVVFQSAAFQADAFQAADVTGGFIGAQIDFTNPRVAFNELTATTNPVLNVFNDVWTGEVFVLKEGIVYWLDVSAGRTYGSYKWRSKIFTMPNRRNIEAMRIWFDTFPDSPTLNPVRNTNLEQTLQADQWGLVRVYADDRLIMCRELREDGEFMRLPSGFKAATYQVEIEARVRITQIELATAAKELINV